MLYFSLNVLLVCFLLLQHRRVIEELKHEREGFQEVLQAKDKELEVTKVLISVETICRLVEKKKCPTFRPNMT